MNKNIMPVIIATVMVLFCFSMSSAQTESVNSTNQKFWIFFSDKGIDKQADSESVSAALTETATAKNIARRQKVRDTNNLFDFADLPVSQLYLESLQEYDLELVHTSKYLNAVSIRCEKSSLAELGSLSFVDSIIPVKIYRKDIPEYSFENRITPKLSKPYSLDYGQSLEQVQQINVPILHEQGLTGAGVLIAIFDTGFDTDHLSFLHMDFVATYDFINNDEDVRDFQDAQRNHGTMVLSVMAGFSEGELIGPAYGASFILGKTEIVTEEIMAEEDNWIAALEWADSIGCDIVQSSVGYIDWYEESDLDGNTALITIAADLAVDRGINVVISIGNSGPAPTTLIAPADGDGVIAVGGVLNSNNLWTGSSRGPTADGRIKPDICARSVSVYMADPNGGFRRANGTSFASPLVSGGIALMLENDPSLTPSRIRDAIWNTGQRNPEITYPNNDYGYGIFDVATASGYALPQTDQDILAYPNPFENIVYISCKISEPGLIKSTIHTLDGSKIWSHELTALNEQEIIAWNGKNSHGRDVAAGLYLIHITGPGLDQTTKLFKVK